MSSSVLRSIVVPGGRWRTGGMSSCAMRSIVVPGVTWRTGGDVFLCVEKYSCARRDVEDRNGQDRGVAQYRQTSGGGRAGNNIATWQHRLH